MIIHLGGRGPGHRVRVFAPPGPLALQILGAPGPATVGSSFNFTPLVQGGTGPYSVTSTAVPPGLTIGTGGATTGKPTAAGTYRVTYTATDAVGATAQLVVDIVVSAIAAASNFILREDGSYLLREDGSRFIREAA